MIGLPLASRKAAPIVASLLSVTALGYGSLSHAQTVSSKNNNNYQFIMNSLAPFAVTRKAPNSNLVSCVPNDPNGDWCKGIIGYTDPVGSPDLPAGSKLPDHLDQPSAATSID
jgi:hypothetical protein